MKKFILEAVRANYFNFIYHGVGGNLIKDKYGQIVPLICFSQRNVVEWCYQDDKDWYEKILKDFLGKENLWNDFREEFMQEGQKLINFLKNLKGLDKLSDKEIFRIFKKFIQIYIPGVRKICFIRALDKAGVKKLERILKEKVNKIDETLAVLTTPEKISYVNKEKKEFLQLLLKKDQEDFDELLKNHSKKWAWVTGGFYTEPFLTEKKLKEKINDFSKILKSKEEVEKELNEIDRKLEKDLEKKKKLLKKLSFKQDNLKLFLILNEGVWLKDFGRAMYVQLGYYSRDLFKELGRRLKLSEKEVRTLTLEEVEESLLGRKKVDKNIFKLRDKTYLVFVKENKVKIVYGKEAKDKRNFFVKELSAQDLKGRVACAGYGKGSTKIINSFKEFGKFRKGDILVANNTTPDYVLLMEKAAAIITEEGGVTCHAAVVSRELGVPCIVGVAGATKILKDGDLVEVDAEKGEVRRIKV